jgi:hypothetical protein
MKKWGIAVAASAAFCACVVALAVTGLWSPPGAADGPPQATAEPRPVTESQAATEPTDGGITVKQGEDALYASRDGSPEVAIPGEAISGEGRLEITPVAHAEGQKGWKIDLTGAELIGKATITFKNAVADGRPAPLIGFNENPGDPITYVQNVQASGSDLVVETDHFSNWWLDFLDWLRGEMDRINAATGNGVQPTCDGEPEARTTVQVESDGGGAVQWCLGQNSSGLNVLKVNNSRGYAVSMERTRGLSIAKRSLDSFGDTIPNLIAGSMTKPFVKGNTVDIVGPGETIEYRVHTSGTAKVRVDPSPPAYLATALWFAAQMSVEVYGRIYKDSVDLEAISIAMDAAGCVGGAESAATTDVTSAQKAGKYFDEALDTAMACGGKALETMAEKRGVDDFFLANVANLFVLAWSGLKTAGTGIGAAIDTSLNLDGYVISLRRGSPGSTPSPEALPVGDNSGLVGSWKGPVTGDQDGYDIVLQLQETGGVLSAKVSYPQLECSGTWTELERKDNLIRFTEKIDHDPKKTCVKTLTSRLTRTATGLHVYLKWIWIEIESDLVRQ